MPVDESCTPATAPVPGCSSTACRYARTFQVCKKVGTNKLFQAGTSHPANRYEQAGLLPGPSIPQATAVLYILHFAGAAKQQGMHTPASEWPLRTGA